MAGNKTITQRIAFSGGEEMEVQLKRLGDAGAYQFKRIREEAEKTSGSFSAGFQKGLADFQRGFDSLSESSKKLTSTWNELGTSAEKMTRNFTRVGLALAGLAAGFLKLTADAGKNREEIENNARAIGLSSAKYEDLKNAFKIAGLEGDVFDKLMTRMARTIDEHNKQAEIAAKKERDLSKQFINGKIDADTYIEKLNDLYEEQRELEKQNKKSGDAFQRLGVDMKKFANDPEAALKELLQALNGLPEGIEKTRLETEIFGKTGNKIAALAGNLNGLVQEGRSFKVAVGEEAVAGLKKFDDSLDHIKITLSTARDAFFGIFAGELGDAINAIGQAIVRNQHVVDLFGDTIVKIKLVIEDFTNFVNNDFVLTGEETPFFQGMIKGILNLKAAIEVVIAVFTTLFETVSTVLTPVADFINRAFGTKVTGDILAMAAAILYLTGGLNVLIGTFKVFFALLDVGWKAIALALSPGGLVLLGLAALAAAALAVYTYWPQITQAWNDFVDSFLEKIDPVVKGYEAVRDAIKSAYEWLLKWLGLKGEQSQQDSGAATGGEGYASGGYVRGPGTGTSDSILARLSDGEFVQRAAATAYYGPRFMSALNNLQIPREILMGLAGFANGGLVRAISHGLPRFATGGMVETGKLAGAQGGHPLTLVIDGEKFTGMTAQDKTFEKLSKFATRRSIQSAGRKPLWVG